MPTEGKKNFTFSLRPEEYNLLVKIAARKDESQSKTLGKIISQKAKQLKLT